MVGAVGGIVAPAPRLAVAFALVPADLPPRRQPLHQVLQAKNQGGARDAGWAPDNYTADGMAPRRTLHHSSASPSSSRPCHAFSL